MVDVELETPAKPAWWTSDEWSTPADFFDRVNRVLGPFDLDACARAETAKAPNFYTLDTDGLGANHDWNGKVWVNPPYSRPGPWVEKAYDQVMANPQCALVVMLLPAAIDTRWYHNWVQGKALVLPVKGRLKFLGWEGKPVGSPPAGNLLAIYVPVGFPAS